MQGKGETEGHGSMKAPKAFQRQLEVLRMRTAEINMEQNNGSSFFIENIIK